MFKLSDDVDLKDAIRFRLARVVTNESISIPVLIDDLIGIVEQSGSYQDAVRPRGPVPTEKPINQCDGCRRGLPVDSNGNHHLDDYPDELQSCTAGRYDISRGAKT